MRKLFALMVGVVLVASSSFATADSLTTLYAGGNGLGSGTMFFDLTVGANDVTIESFDTNSDSTTAFNAIVHAVAGGTYDGNEQNAAFWGGPVTTGVATPAGTGNPSNIALASSFVLSANTTYAMALIMDADMNYTNGDGTNQSYTDGNITLDLGSSAASQDFTAGRFNPRVWNGTVNYSVVPEPAALTLLAFGTVAIAAKRRRK